MTRTDTQLDPWIDPNVILTVDVPLGQFETGTTISAWCEWTNPTHRTVLILRRGVLLWASRVELAPLLFPSPSPEEATTTV